MRQILIMHKSGLGRPFGERCRVRIRTSRSVEIVVRGLLNLRGLFFKIIKSRKKALCYNIAKDLNLLDELLYVVTFPPLVHRDHLPEKRDQAGFWGLG